MQGFRCHVISAEGSDLRGVIAATRFGIADNAACGVQVGPNGAVDLSDGVVNGNPVGANVQDSAFDVSRLTRGVRFVDNGRPFDTSMLPVPGETAATPL